MPKIFSNLPHKYLAYPERYGYTFKMVKGTPIIESQVKDTSDFRHPSSQCPLKNWHDHIGNRAMADAILDRIIHNCHKIEIQRESMRLQKYSKK